MINLVSSCHEPFEMLPHASLSAGMLSTVTKGIFLSQICLGDQHARRFHLGQHLARPARVSLRAMIKGSRKRYAGAAKV